MLILGVFGWHDGLFHKWWYVVVSIGWPIFFVVIEGFDAVLSGRGSKQGFKAALKNPFSTVVGWLEMPVKRLIVHRPRLSIKGALMAVGCVALLTAFTGAFGRGVAATKNLPILNSNPPKLLLARYGDTLVFAEYDTASSTILPVFSTIPRNQLGQLSLSITNFATRPRVKAR